MREDVREAVDSARDQVGAVPGIREAVIRRRRPFGTVKFLVLRVVRELPDDMTMAELRMELEEPEDEWERRERRRKYSR